VRYRGGEKGKRIRGPRVSWPGKGRGKKGEGSSSRFGLQSRKKLGSNNMEPDVTMKGRQRTPFEKCGKKGGGGKSNGARAEPA